MKAIKSYFLDEAEHDQGWFWDDEWQVGEREAELDIQGGNLTRYGNAADFLDSLK